MYSSWSIADGEMLSLGEALKAARAGHVEVIEQAGDENHQLCVSKAAKRVSAQSLVFSCWSRILLYAYAHARTLGESVEVLP